MGAIQHFSTRSVAPHARLDYWNECARTTFAGMSVDAGRAPFDAELARWTIGDLVMARPRSQGSSVRRASDTKGPEQIVLHLLRRGSAVQHQRARDLMLRPGDLSACTTASPLRLGTNDHEMLVVQVPRPEIERRVADVDDRIGDVVSGAAPAVRLLHDYLLSLWREAELAAEAEGAPDRAAADILLDLVALALRGAPVPARNDRGELGRLKALVEARLSDPELRGATLAGELGISLRWVQHLFATCATTPGGYILHRRLERAAALLAGDPGRSVTQLAFDLGFNDSAYFSRRFRAQFGVTPTAWRSGHRFPASR